MGCTPGRWGPGSAGPALSRVAMKPEIERGQERTRELKREGKRGQERTRELKREGKRGQERGQERTREVKRA